MTQSKDGNGNGHEENTPKIEFEYLAADVWKETDADGNLNVVYTDQIIESLGGAEKNSDN